METDAGNPAPHPKETDEGADVTLIRWMLSLSPAQRLEVLQRQVNSILELRERNPNL